MEYPASPVSSAPSSSVQREIGFSVSRPAALILSLMSVLGLLCLPFGRAGGFSAFAVLVLSMCVCVLAGRKGVVAALLIPVYLIVLVSGDFTFSAMAAGTVISASSLALLCLGGRRGIAAALVSFAASAAITLAVTGSVFEGSLLLIPGACWVSLRIVFGKKNYASSLLILSASLLGALAVSLLLVGLYADTPEWMSPLIPSGGESAPELWRRLISDRLVSIRTSAGNLTDRKTADIAAVLAVNLLPGAAALTAELIALVQYALSLSLYDATGKGGALSDECRGLAVSPLCAMLYTGSLMLSMILVSIETEGGEFFGTVLDNMNLVLSPVFLIIGIRFVYSRLCARFAEKQNGSTLAFVLILIGAAISLNLFIVVFIGFGIFASVLPALKKIGEKINFKK